MYQFTGVVSSFYWSSRTSSGDPNFAWIVEGGGVGLAGKGNTFYVWPVRGGP